MATNTKFTTWLGYILLAIVCYSFMPDKLKLPFVGITLLGGLTIISRQRGGLADFTTTVFGKDLSGNVA